MSENRRHIDCLYDAIKRKDAAALETVIDAAFAPDAVMRISDSLPYGGAHEGIDTIRAMLLGLVTMKAPIVQPEGIVIQRVAEDGDQVVAEAAFPWLAPGAQEPIAMSAVEWFTFRDGRITEMKVVYWDTAACAKAARAARAA